MSAYSSYFSGDVVAIEGSLADRVAATGVVQMTGRAGHFAAAEATADRLMAAGFLGSLSTTQTINVSNYSELENAVATANANPGTAYTIVLAAGTYLITGDLPINAAGLTIRSATGDRAAVTVRGDAMSASANVGNVFRVTGNNVTIRDISIGLCKWSAVQLSPDNGPIFGFKLQNCRCFNTYEHFVKGAVVGANGSISGLVENCLFEYTAGMAPNYYTGGIDVHRGSSWIVRNNEFRDIASPSGSAAQHAINFWNGSTNNTFDSNKVIDCDRGIGSGLNGNPANSGDTIVNNQIYHSANSDPFADVLISVENSLNAKVYNNTCYSAHTGINWALECRYTTTGADFKNNLANKQTLMRDGGALAVNSNNVANAQASYFVAVASGNLNLASSVAGVVNAGATIASVTKDFKGTTRPQGGGYDIGADEYIAQSSNPLDLPRLNTSQIQYLGKFLLPENADPFGGEGFKYGPTQGGGAIAYNPANNSLFVVGHGAASNQVMAEVSIPAPKTSAFNRATLLQNFVRACGGNQGAVQSGANGNVVTGLLLSNGRLILTVGGLYLDAVQVKSTFVRTSLNLASGSVQGPCSVTTVNQRYFGAGAGGILSANWRPVFGDFDAVGGGGGNLSLANNYSNGPTFIFYNSGSVSGTGTIAGNPAVYYPSPDTLGVFSGPYSLMWNGMSSHRGTIVLPGYRTFLAYGKHGDSNYQGGGQVATMMRDRFWLVDARDIKQAFDGQIGPSSVVPYATFDMNFTSAGSAGGNESAGVRGCTYDPVNNLIYVVANYDGGNSFPAIHVLKINV